MIGSRPDVAGKAVAVSVTPLPLEADSRAFRIAQSLGEAGFRSIIVEGRASARHFWSETVEVRSVGRAVTEDRGGSILPPGRLRDSVLSMRRMGAASQVLLYGAFRAHDWWRYCWAPRPLIPPANLYVLHSFEFYRAVAPFARRSGARIFYDAHDFYRGIEPIERQSSFDRNHIHPFFRRLEGRLAVEANAITTVSNGIAGLMAEAFGRRPDVIRNCHDERYDRARVPPLRKTLGLGEADRLAVMVGNYKPGLAIHAAAAALQRLPENLHFAFLGRGYSAVATALPGGLVGRRLHLGHAVPPDEIVPAIRGCDLGLVLYEPYSDNYRYALPNGFFQLVAAGLPIVRGELPEIESAIAGRAVGYSLAQLEPEAIAQAVTRAMAERTALRANVTTLTRSLRWENEARRLRRLIDKMHVIGGTAVMKSEDCDVASATLRVM
jgi:glycosyltransferase involved in cell wall biosynthesis